MQLVFRGWFLTTLLAGVGSPSSVILQANRLLLVATIPLSSAYQMNFWRKVKYSFPFTLLSSCSLLFTIYWWWRLAVTSHTLCKFRSMHRTCGWIFWVLLFCCRLHNFVTLSTFILKLKIRDSQSFLIYCPPWSCFPTTIKN